MAKHEKSKAKSDRSKNPVEQVASAAADAVGSVAGAVGEAIETVADTVTRDGAHAAAKPHGRPATVDESLPATRDELLARHADARHRRAAAPLGSDAYRDAADEIARIEIRIAAIEQDQAAATG
jgi:hypothetical protein